MIDAILSAVLDTTDDMICAIDAEACSLLACNSAIARHFATKWGKTLRIGARLEDVLDAENVARWKQLFRRALNEGPLSIGHRGRVEGQTLWLSFNRLVKDGQCFGVSSIARDITQFERVIRATQSAEDRFTKVFRHNPFPLGVTTAESGVFLDVNPALVELLGYERSELIGRTAEQVGIWANASKRAHLLEAMRPTGRIVDFAANFRRPDGRLLNVLLACEAINLDGVDCLLISIADVTPLHNAEQALRESEVRYRALIDTAPEAIVLIDADTGVFTDTNENASRLTGYEKSALVGMDPADLGPITQPDGSLSADLIKASLERAARGEPVTLDWVFHRPDGSPLTCEIRLTPFPGSSRRLVRGSIIDISQRKRLEREASELRAQLEQAQRLESLGTLAGGIAHDFNNILCSIVGYAELVLMHEQDAKIRSFIEDIERGANRAKDLVRQILAFSRQTSHDKKPVQIANVVKEAVRLLRAALPSTIVVKQRYDTSGWVLTDPTQIHQVVMNLGTNAGLAMRDKCGNLDVSVTEKDVDAQTVAQHPGLQPGRHLSLTVKDTGCGIAPENLGRIFEPFFTTRPPGEGTGLGLSVAYGIVRDAGGAIVVASELGVGTTFEVLLPLCPIAAEEDAPVVARKAAGSQHVLFVDDDPAIAKVAGITLGDLGYEVTTFTDPSDAIAAFRKGPGAFDVLVTDATMPRITGSMLGAVIKKIRPELPMILVSGAESRLRQEAVRAAGFDACLSKPYRPTELAQVIQDLFGKGPVTTR